MCLFGDSQKRTGLSEIKKWKHTDPKEPQRGQTGVGFTINKDIEKNITELKYGIHKKELFK